MKRILKVKDQLSKFFLDVIVSNNPFSAKRATTLIMLGYLMLYSTIVSIAFVGVIFWATKGDLEKIKIMAALFDTIVDKATLIVLFGLGGITSVDLVSIWKQKLHYTDYDDIPGNGCNEPLTPPDEKIRE